MAKKGFTIASLLLAGGITVAGAGCEKGKGITEEEIINALMLGALKRSEVVQSETDAEFESVKVLGATRGDGELTIFGSAVYDYYGPNDDFDGLISLNYDINNDAFKNLDVAGKLELIKNCLDTKTIKECSFTPVGDLNKLNEAIGKMKGLENASEILAIHKVFYNAEDGYVAFQMLSVNDDMVYHDTVYMKGTYQEIDDMWGNNYKFFDRFTDCVETGNSAVITYQTTDMGDVDEINNNNNYNFVYVSPEK